MGFGSLAKTEWLKSKKRLMSEPLCLKTNVMRKVLP